MLPEEVLFTVQLATDQEVDEKIVCLLHGFFYAGELVRGRLLKNEGVGGGLGPARVADGSASVD